MRVYYQNSSTPLCETLNELRPQRSVKWYQNRIAYLEREIVSAKQSLAESAVRADKHKETYKRRPYALCWNAKTSWSKVNVKHFTTEKQLVTYYLRLVLTSANEQVGVAVWRTNRWFPMKLETVLERVRKQGEKV